MEKQVKFCQERASHVEKHYGGFCQTLGSINRKIARMRDKGDILAKQLLAFAEQEKISVSTRKNLQDFAHNFAAVQDYRDAEIHRLDSKVVKPLTAYGPKCKKMKQIIKTEQGAINREIKQRKNLEKVRDKKPGDAHSIHAAETELQKAASDAAIGSRGLQNQMKTFEKEKITDLKRILADFVSIEMVFHAKAIEYYSQCFENLAMIDEELDLEEFSRKLNLQLPRDLDTLGSSLPPGTSVLQGTVTSLGSTGLSSTLGDTGTSEYTSTGESYTYTYGDSTASSGEKRVRIQTVGQSMYADVDEEDDDDDEDDDEDDDDDEEENNVPVYSQPVRRR